MKIKVNGQYVDDFTFIKNFSCSYCGATGSVRIDHKGTNNALQARCPGCDRFLGNFKYDDDFGGVENAAQTVSE